MSLTTLAASPMLAAGSPNIQGWPEVAELMAAFALSMIIGVEREIHQKSAGLRTHTLVGVGAALFMLISKYGFNDVLVPGRIVLDPSRVAAQIVSGVGFLGAGLIFVRRDSVRGLTTAAAVWVTAAVGAACGAGLIVLAVAATFIYFIVATVFPHLARRLPRASSTMSVLRVRYPDGRGVLREILALATARGFALSEISTEAIGYQRAPGSDSDRESEGTPMVGVTLHVRGQALVNDLVAALSELPGVDAVLADDAEFFGE
ncbi:MAG: MgtC/SapB family protein [Acidimicrobiales bacterium]|jgi:putative Mg2+ transporter-C (MgtC) family protein